ncbi:MAG: hypothetical protein MJ159_05265 [Treponemataceae bacterium]|nr:hypothetical protein [Treponemataceae bacterium]
MIRIIKKILFTKNIKTRIDSDKLAGQEDLKEIAKMLTPNESKKIVNDYECNVLICMINSEINFKEKITEIVSALTDKFIVTTIKGNIIIALINDFLIENDKSLFSDTKTVILRRKIHRALIDTCIPINLDLFSLSEEFFLNYRKMNFGDFIYQVQGEDKCSLIKNKPKDLWWFSRNYETNLYLIFIGFVKPEYFNEIEISKIVKKLRQKKFIVTNTSFIGNVIVAYKKLPDKKISALKIKGVRSLLLSKKTTVELLGDGKFLPFSPIFSFTDNLIDMLLSVDYGDCKIS